MDDGKSTDPACKRGDNKDLINAWKVDKTTKGKKAAFLENRKDLLDTHLDSNDYVLGTHIDRALFLSFIYKCYYI